MKFWHVTEKLNQNGSSESASTEYNQDEILIGRGGDSHLILGSQSVSLVHAKLRFVVGKLIVEDQNSIAGVRVNGRRVTLTDLSAGDKIQIGDVHLVVKSISPDEVVLTQKVDVAPPIDREEVVAKQLDALRIGRYLPSIRLLSLFVAFLIVIFYLFMPMVGQHEAWNSGPISNSHKMIDGDCESCHAKPFQQVQDKECLKCHNLSEHAKALPALVANKPELNFRCAQCHMEHNGDHGLIAEDSRLCSDCHGELKNLKPETKYPNVRDFDSHPEFQIDVLDSNDRIDRVSLDNKSEAVDGAHLKLNHALHLRSGLRGRDGPVTLQCAACHQLNENARTIKPINFENHCQDCHTLGFDSRLPSAQVPHGDDEAVYPALFTEYTKLLLLKSNSVNRPQPTVAPTFERSLPGGTGVPNAAKPEIVDASLVEKESRTAEKELFTKTACFVCHDAFPKFPKDKTATNSHFQVVKPRVPEVWLRKAIFSHGAHEEVSCESCHNGVRSSSKTSDVLLPSIKACKDCHSHESKQGFVKSDCILCHSYHDPLGFPYEKKKSIGDYISLIKR